MQVTLNMLDDFECLADQCPLTCCMTWSLPVDGTTLDKWSSLSDQSLKDELNAAIVQDENQNSMLKLNSKGYCVLLNDDKKCSLQLSAGHEYLSEACREYPRRSRTEDLRNIKTASMGCPAITQQLLSISVPDSLFTISGALKPATAKLDFNPELASMLDDVYTQIIQAQRFPLKTRLLLLTRILNSLSVYSQKNNLNRQTLQKLFNKPKQQLYDLTQLVKSKRIKPSAEQAGQFWCMLYIISIGTKPASFLKSFPQASFFDQADKLISGKSTNFSEFYDTVSKLRSAALPELSNIDAFGTNYFVLKCVNSGFPMQPAEGNFIATFLNCLFPYALLQLFLWMLFDQKKSITKDDIALAASVIERQLGHNTTIYEILEKHPQFMQLDNYADCLLDL
ncbi:MAG: flagellin lysine-N-methylase [Gammaproteobacteria bacterium]|nr:flagellin lysine-N-methylase [Gammaproteobacteria bacterium]